MLFQCVSIKFAYLIATLLIAESQQTELWTITFHTGNKLFSGTNLDIYLQLNGNLASSNVIIIKPLKRITSGSVNKFKINVDKNIGKIESLMIEIKPAFPIFNDWNLYKAELVDPLNQTYTFYCDCWLKYAFSRRIIHVSKTNDSDYDTYMENSQHFSLTIGLFSLLTFVFIIVYITNVIRKRWRNRINLLYFNERNNARSRRDDETNNEHITLSPPSHDINSSNQVNTNVTTSFYNDKIDNPPDYKDLFPSNNSSADTNRCTNLVESNKAK